MTDTTPISDHDATSEEEANELRKIHQDDDGGGGLGGVDNVTESLTRPLQGNDQDGGDIVDDSVLNDREQRHG